MSASQVWTFLGRCTASSSSLNVCFRGHGLEIPLIQPWRSDSAFLPRISGLTEGRVISLRSSFTFWCCRMLSVFSCECGLLQCPATVFGERLQRILSFRGGRTEPLFVYSISRWCVCVCVRQPLSNFPWQLPLCRLLQLFQVSWNSRQSELLWKHLVLFKILSVLSAHFEPNHTAAWPATMVFSCTLWERGVVLEGAQWNVVHVLLQLICQGAFPGRLASVLLKSLSLQHTERQASSQTSGLGSSGPWHC